MSKLDKLAQATDKWVENFRVGLVTFTSWAPMTFFVGVCLGFSAWFLYQPDLMPSISAKEVDVQQRYDLLMWMVISVVAVIIFYTEAHRRYRRKNDVEFYDFARQLNRYAIIVCIIPLYLFLRTEDLGKDRPYIALAGSLTMGMILVYFTYQLAALKRWPLAKVTNSAKWPLVFVILLSVAYTAAIIILQTRHHQSLGTRAWDFGLYINSMWHSLHGNFLGCSLIREGTHIDRHFDPILVILSPMLAIYRSEYALIYFQATWVASGAIPLYLLGKHKMGHPFYGILLCSVYLLHPAVHGPNMYDFHSIVLAFPMLLWCMYCLEAEKFKAYWVFLGILLLIREDTPALAAIMAFFFIISGRLYRVSAITILVCVIYGGLVNFVIMSDAHSYVTYFKEHRIEGHTSGQSIFLSIFTNPGYVLKIAFQEERILYLIQVMMPILMLPLFSKKHWVFYIWGMATTFLSSWNGFLKLGTQYAVYWMPFGLTAVPYAVDNLSNGRLAKAFKWDGTRMKPALMAGMLASAVAMSSLYGVFWPNSAFRPGYEEFHRETTPEIAARFETIKKIKKIIPDDAKVLGTRRVCAHFSLRDHIWSFARKQKDGQIPDYVIIWSEDLKNKKAKKTQKPKYKHYTTSRDYRLVLNENEIKLYVRKAYEK